MLKFVLLLNINSIIIHYRTYRVIVFQFNIPI